MNAPTFTASEFRERIARIINGAGPQLARAAHPCVVRSPSDRGFYPPSVESELARLEARFELETDEGGTAREKALAIWKVGRK